MEKFKFIALDHEDLKIMSVAMLRKIKSITCMERSDINKITKSVFVSS